VEPLTNYGVLSLRKDMRDGASVVGVMGTATNRDIDDPVFDSDPTFNAWDEFGSLFGDDQRNTFVVKLNYWVSI